MKKQRIPHREFFVLSFVTPVWEENMIEEKIGYKFKNKSILTDALTRRSYAVENSLKTYNQRLEFLGDSVLGLTIAEELYKRLPKTKEGQLTKLKASIVCEKSLAVVANEINISDYLRIGKGEQVLNIGVIDSTTSDTLEALFGAVYLDSDFDTAKSVILRLLKKIIEEATSDDAIFDSKSTLQELIQKTSKTDLIYTLISEEGPEHDKVFVSAVSHKGKELGKGEGKTKKEAEKMAASAALKKLKK